MFSQIVDTVTILTILYATGGLGADITTSSALIGLMISSYTFKLAFAMFDTPLFYFGVRFLEPRVNLHA